MTIKMPDMEVLQAAGAVAFKAGKEAERQTDDEILRMARLFTSRDKVWVKLGGPEDGASLKELYHQGFKRFVAPLVETSFAVRKFLEAVRWATGGRPELLELSLNLESVSAYHYRRTILSAPETALIGKINVGKTDLGLSIGKSADDDEVLAMAAAIVDEARAHGKRTGVGGSINMNMIEKVLDVVQPDEVETRHVVMEVAAMRDPVASVRTALEFEQALLAAEIEYYNFNVGELKKRQAGLAKRFAPGGVHAA